MIISQKTLYKFIQTNTNVNWDKISAYKNLSEKFKKEFKYKLK